MRDIYIAEKSSAALGAVAQAYQMAKKLEYDGLDEIEWELFLAYLLGTMDNIGRIYAWVNGKEWDYPDALMAAREGRLGVKLVELKLGMR